MQERERKTSKENRKVGGGGRNQTSGGERRWSALGKRARYQPEPGLSARVRGGR